MMDDPDVGDCRVFKNGWGAQNQDSCNKGCSRPTNRIARPPTPGSVDQEMDLKVSEIHITGGPLSSLW